MSQNEEPVPTPKNRRFGPRRKPRGMCKVTFTHGTGSTDLAQMLLDVSRSGARLMIRSELTPGMEVEVGLPWPRLFPRDPMRATVAWCLAAANGGFCVGVQFHRLLSEADLRSVIGGSEWKAGPTEAPKAALPEPHSVPPIP